MMAIDDFRAAMVADGLRPPPHIQGDNQTYRCATAGKPKKRNGAYCFDLRTGTGWYRDHGGSGELKLWPPAGANGHDRETPEETAKRIEAAKAAIEKRRKAAEAAAADAERRWQKAKPAKATHPYLKKKGIGPNGARQDGDVLLIPLRDVAGKLHALQTIPPSGDPKLFGKGSATAGHFFSIGDLATTPAICIGEGFATMARIFETTGDACIVAFSDHNLVPVTDAIAELHPDALLILCADDDHLTTGNPGLTYAKRAASHVPYGVVAVPVFGLERADDQTDFADMVDRDGVTAIINDAIADAQRRREVKEIEKPTERGEPPPAKPTDEDWPTPKPIVSELKPVPVFEPAKMLPEPLASWVHQAAYAMSCPPEYIAMPAMVALGSLIGTRCAVKPKRHDNWIEVPNLWGAVVGPPGSKKSPAFGVAFSPLNHLISVAMKSHKEDLENHRVEKAVYDAETEILKASLKPAIKKGGDAKAEAVAALKAHMNNPPTVPTVRRYKANDSTAEKLGELLKENPTGILVARDELVGLMAAWDREGREGERAFFLESWNGTGSFSVDRIKRGSTLIPHLCLSLIGGMQPDKLVAYLEQIADSLDNDGLLQRFQLLVYPDPGKWQWRDDPPRGDHGTKVFDLFAGIVNATADDWQANPSDNIPFLSLDDDAKEMFSVWSEKLHDRIASEKEPLICQHLSKYDKLMLALALIFHLAEDGKGPLTSRTIRRATLWCDFLEAHARRCYGLFHDKGFRAATILSTKLREGALEDGFTLRDVRRNEWRHLIDEKAVQAAIEWLEDDDWIKGVAARPKAGGRPTIRYLVNPKVRPA